MRRVEISGLIRSLHFQRARLIAQDLKVDLSIRGLLQADWQLLLKQYQQTDDQTELLAWVDGVLYTSSQSFNDWAVDEFKYNQRKSMAELQRIAQQEYVSYLSQSKKKYVQWTVLINSTQFRLLLQLDFGRCPRTCENFWQLSNGFRDLGYRDSSFHRIVPNGFIQGGFLKSGESLVNSSIYGSFFHDENYCYSHDKPGVLGMSKAGRHQNGSVFYLTTRALPHLNGNSVAFGRVVEGLDTLKEIQQVECQNQRPINPITITKCGNYLISLAPLASEGSRPRSQKEKVQSKLEAADIETLMLRRQAILREIESTREELEQQRRFREVLTELISELS